ncbi:putative 5-formyltetrahydrofolate cyclo-ligase [Hyphodiscus hymeniophilus]|uniref:5-formyltetrahydrofolate cyclo-ligase n=1 Tax=Hyphodiscus hymeniophilus TaxID=353542 RepID=A0A9P7AXI7_9HELO|nr:putative 5-formyltetrahydrofolate cyclo-ligase [Hyphodiscus hymeniophilus]
MASSTALKAAKKELRSLLKQELSGLTNVAIDDQSSAVFKRVTGFKAYQEAKRIGIYLSMPTGELQTDAIVRHALGAGKQVFVPYLFKPSNPPPDTPKSVMDMVDVRSLPDYDSLKRDSWGIPTMEADTVEGRERILNKRSQPLDAILMPGVAFDIDPESGFIRRLGHGKGFYDYFLHRYKQIYGSRDETSPGTDVLLYGLALEEQFLKSDSGTSVPVGKHDNLLHGMIVGDGEIVEGPIPRE